MIFFNLLFWAFLTLFYCYYVRLSIYISTIIYETFQNYFEFRSLFYVRLRLSFAIFVIFWRIFLVKVWFYFEVMYLNFTNRHFSTKPFAWLFFLPNIFTRAIKFNDVFTDNFRVYFGVVRWWQIIFCFPKDINWHLFEVIWFGSTLAVSLIWDVALEAIRISFDTC